MNPVALQSREHRDLLDNIDKLRAQGISKYIDLPQIIVCGDQSSGKSSVLEGISGLCFPTKDNLCTRFATEVVLRRDATKGINISIRPGPDRGKPEHDRLRAWTVPKGISFDKGEELGMVIELAKKEMGISDAKVFSTDTLRIELSGPTQPHLTIVDLPGLFRAGNSEQSVRDAPTVRKMVSNYMKSPRSIILAVVSAQNDYSLQEVTELARNLDAKGQRTLGLITKPDTLDEDSDKEKSYVRLAMNLDVCFKLGWHVVKNRSYKEKDSTNEERNAIEKRFFESGIWADMDRNIVGIEALRIRLSNVLKDQIVEQLPNLLKDIANGIAECKQRIAKLGVNRDTIQSQRHYLASVARDFSELMKQSVEGSYSGPFFGSVKTDEGYAKRLRALVQNRLADFNQDMHTKGKAQNILEDWDNNDDDENDEEEEDDDEKRGNAPNAPADDPRRISRKSYMEEVKEIMRKTRGRELPGTFNPMTVADLFAEQCQPWRGIIAAATADIIAAVYETSRMIVEHITADDTKTRVYEAVCDGIRKLEMDVHAKVEELLRPHYEGHPITYNHYLTETVQRVQKERLKKSLMPMIAEAFRLEDTKVNLDTITTNNKQHQLYPGQLMQNLIDNSLANMEAYGASSATDFMQAYYKVAIKKCIDDVGALAIEQSLIRHLPSLLTSDAVYNMDDEAVRYLVAESPAVAQGRRQCAEKLAVLEAGMLELRKLTRV